MGLLAVIRRIIGAVYILPCNAIMLKAYEKPPFFVPMYDYSNSSAMALSQIIRFVNGRNIEIDQCTVLCTHTLVQCNIVHLHVGRPKTGGGGKHFCSRTAFRIYRIGIDLFQ